MSFIKGLKPVNTFEFISMHHLESFVSLKIDFQWQCCVINFEKIKNTVNKQAAKDQKPGGTTDMG